MNPDVAVGAGMVAVGVTAYAVNTVACRWALTREATLEPVADDIDDLVAVAAAVGVYQPDTSQCEGPCASWITAAATVCGHGRVLCEACALGECDECLTDLRCQGVLSQYVTGTFPTGGAA